MTSHITSSTKPNILIVGSGAIGLLWYSHLNLRCKAQTNVYLYQSPQRNPVSKTINFTDLHHQIHTIPTQIYTPNDSSTSASIREHSFDIILVCVKSYQLNGAIEEIHPLISANTLVINSHNGLGALNNENQLKLAHRHVWNLLTTHGCLKSSNNSITHTGSGVSNIGPQIGIPSHTLIQQTTALLNTALPEVAWCDHLAEKQWTKLAINCVINPLTALFDIKNGEVADAKFDQVIDQLLDEITDVANANEIKLDKGLLKRTVIIVANNTAENSSSMRCDIQAKRKSEIEYINGYIHRLGIELNISTQKNTELYQSVLALHSERDR